MNRTQRVTEISFLGTEAIGVAREGRRSKVRNITLARAPRSDPRAYFARKENGTIRQPRGSEPERLWERLTERRSASETKGR